MRSTPGIRQPVARSQNGPIWQGPVVRTCSVPTSVVASTRRHREVGSPGAVDKVHDFAPARQGRADTETCPRRDLSAQMAKRSPGEGEGLLGIPAEGRFHRMGSDPVESRVGVRERGVGPRRRAAPLKRGIEHDRREPADIGDVLVAVEEVGASLRHARAEHLVDDAPRDDDDGGGRVPTMAPDRAYHTHTGKPVEARSGVPRVDDGHVDAVP
jgi:hypothetical protein